MRQKRVGSVREDEAEWIEPVLPGVETALDVPPAVQAHNLTDLLALYYQGTAAHRAPAVLERARARRGKGGLRRLLRHHRREPIRAPAEIDARAAVDDLLTCYAVLELAFQAGYISALDPPFAGQALRILRNPVVRRYYETYYPLLLPQLLRERLRGRPGIRAHRGPRQVAALQRVLELVLSLRDGQVEMFLLFADDFTVDGLGRGDLLAALASPAEFLRRVARKRRDHVDNALHGLRKFLFLCEGLHRVLATLDEDPVFQSALWHLLGYWFDERGDSVVPGLRMMLDRFDTWPDDGDDPGGAGPSRPARTAGFRAAIEALASDRYARALEQAAVPMLAPARAGRRRAAAPGMEQLIRLAVEAVSARALRRDVAIVTDLPEEIPGVGKVLAAARDLERAVLSAVQLAPDRGFVGVAVVPRPDTAPGAVDLEVTARGVRGALVKQLLEPGRTGGYGRSGAGQGLTLAREMMASPREDLSVTLSPERDLTFTLRLAPPLEP